MRLIDADALLDRLKKDPLFDLVERYGISGVIEAAPTVEAQVLNENENLGREYVAQDIKNGKGFIVGHFVREPVVRCKDCEMYNGLIECWNGLLTEPNDFCSFGVRKEGDDVEIHGRDL